MDAKFESFWNALNQCPYELPEEIQPYIKQALKAAGFFDQGVISTDGTGGGGAVATKTKKLSGYNLFMREKMAELKTQEVPSGERMGMVSQMWKLVSDEQKTEWKNKAAGLNPQVVATTTTKKATGPKKLSGYQVYLKATMPEVKVNAEIPPKERMGAIAKMWKALSEEQRGEWKTKDDQARVS